MNNRRFVYYRNVGGDTCKELAAFGQRLREVREQLKLKQKTMAAGVGVTGSALSSLESGKSKPSYDVMRNIYTKFDISIDYLMDGFGDALVDRESVVEPVPDELSPEYEKKKELLYYMENAPMVKFAVFAHFAVYLYDNKEAIKDDMEKHRAYLEKVKQNKDLKKRKE